LFSKKQFFIFKQGNPTMKDATLKQIATQLGVSITTVSKVSKDYPDVSKKLKNAVIDLAKKLNYTPIVLP
jgi:LacI family transcriptional regulator